jgi:two-component system response regulator YesN
VTDDLFTIIIVDDEAVVREGVRDRIDWETLGFRLVGDYEDGRAALAAVRADPPDVILSDIRMPFLDGIELARTVAEEHPTTRVLLLTGHDEFEYAQEAVRLQVWDFLLKPVSARELTGVLERLAAELQVERTRRDAEERLRVQWQESLPLLRERALNDLLAGSDPPDAYLLRLANLGLTIAPGRIRVIIVSPDPEGRSDLQGLAVANVVDELCTAPGGGVQFAMNDGDIVVLLPGTDGDLFDRLDQLRRRVAEETEGSVTIAVGPAQGALREVRGSYRAARQRLMQRFLTGGNRIITSEESSTDAAGWGERHRDVRTALVALIRNVDREGAREALESLILICREQHLPVATCILNLQRDLARVIDSAEALDIDVGVLFPGGGNPFEELASLPSLTAIREWFGRLIDRIIDALEDRVRDQAERKVRAAETYLQENFRDPSVSLTAVCAELSVSVSYFSQRFKMVTGRTFVEYLTELRIAHAQELLRTGSGRGYEIAPQVGFRDPHYFSTTFKKVVGMTPTQYRNRYGAGS